jgi:hypothetical protein
LQLGGVVELGRLGALVQFSVLAVGMFTLYIAHAYFQEKIFSMPQFKFFFFVSFCDFVLFFVLAGAQLMAIEGRIPRNSPLHNFLGLSLSLAVSIGCGFASLAYLNYPTKVLFKSGKIIPTMLMGKLFGRSYSLMEYLAGCVFRLVLLLFCLIDCFFLLFLCLTPFIFSCFAVRRIGCVYVGTSVGFAVVSCDWSGFDQHFCAVRSCGWKHSGKCAEQTQMRDAGDCFLVQLFFGHDCAALFDWVGGTD